MACAATLSRTVGLAWAACYVQVMPCDAKVNGSARSNGWEIYTANLTIAVNAVVRGPWNATHHINSPQKRYQCNTTYNACVTP